MALHVSSTPRITLPLAGTGRFRLLRRLSIFSLLALVATAAILMLLHRHDHTREHRTSAAHDNQSTAHDLAERLRGPLMHFIAEAQGLDADGLRAHPDVGLLDQPLSDRLDRQLIKIALLDPSGMTLYSSVRDEIGTTIDHRRALDRALKGETPHEATFEEIFRTSTGELSDRHMVHTFVPLHDKERIAAVLALHADITPAIERMDSRTVEIALLLAVAFAALYAALMVSLRRADRAVAAWQDMITASAREVLTQEGRLRAMLGTALDGVIVIDAADTLIEFNPAAEAMFGWSKDEIIGRPMAELLIPERYRAAHLEGLGRFTRTRESRVVKRRFEISALRRDGTEFPVELSISTQREGERDFFTACIRDISDRKRIEEEMRIAAIAFDSQEGMFITDATGIIQRVNRAFVLATGYSAAEAVGKSPSLLRSGRHDADFYAEMWQALQINGYWQGEIWNRRKNGEIYPEWLTITAVKNTNGELTHHVATFSDITHRKAAEEEIKHLAFYDPLTRLPNRRLLLDRLRHALASGARNRRHGALLFLDLDHFKQLNDSLGHAMGDLLLQQVATRLEKCVREGDTVARLGGDEFVVMLEGLSGHVHEAAAQAEAIGEQMLATLNEPYPLGAHRYHSTPSIGIALFLGHRIAIDDLLKRADLAMYRAKAAGRNTLRFFDLEMQAAVEARAALGSDLRRALQENQLELHFQRQVDDTGRTTGAEALLRWRHPQRGLILPSEFLPLAEESRLIVPIGEWVLHAACAQLAQWAAHPDTGGRVMAVNIGTRQFRNPEFVRQVMAAIDSSRVDPSHLRLELAEHLLDDEADETGATMDALKAKGVSFALNDYGTNKSSLSYLKRLPFDQLKIGRSFVRNITTDANDTAIVRAIIGLGRNLGLNVIAVGVETEAQRDVLLAHHCHAFQGDLFGAPEPARTTADQDI